MKISVCAPSYRRPKVLTLAYLPFCRVYVDPVEAAAYRAAKKHEPILCVKARGYHRRRRGPRGNRGNRSNRGNNRKAG